MGGAPAEEAQRDVGFGELGLAPGGGAAPHDLSLHCCPGFAWEIGLTELPLNLESF